jgi:hypothetical protein
MGPPPPFGPPPPRNRKPLIIMLSVGGAAVLVTLIVVAVVSASGSGGSGSAGDAVKGYLQALSRGDAKAALSYSSDQPASQELLTDEILKKQVAKWPITDIKILNDDGGYGFGRVHVSARFGNQVSDETIPVKKSGKKWKLEHAAVKLDPSIGAVNNKAMKTLTVFGKRVASSPLYVFPGWVDLGSDNPSLKVDAKRPFLLNDLMSGNTYFTDVEFALSDKGSSAISSAISSALRECTDSSQLSPPNCPQRVFKAELVDGTATWGTPNINGLETRLDPYRLTAMISGEVVFPLKAETRSGDTWKGTYTLYMSGDADLSQDPPTIRLR